MHSFLLQWSRISFHSQQQFCSLNTEAGGDPIQACSPSGLKDSGGTWLNLNPFDNKKGSKEFYILCFCISCCTSVALDSQPRKEDCCQDTFLGEPGTFTGQGTSCWLLPESHFCTAFVIQ